ncbi:MAG: hypothetical protein LBF28_00740 [Rickettsiales bacterium]|jgi:hypothetical protein|nr:hypothetical protein [Rickettsiales bacterium]
MGGCIVKGIRNCEDMKTAMQTKCDLQSWVLGNFYSHTETEQEKHANNAQMDKIFFTRTKEYFLKWKLPYKKAFVLGMADGSSKTYAKVVAKTNIESIMPIFWMLRD